MTSCAGRPGYLPRFQPQNPAISGDPYGWDNCTAYAAAMAGDFDTCGQTVLTGERVRQLSNEPVPDPESPGLNLHQVDDALNRYGVDLEVRYRLPWDDFVRRIDKGEGAILQIGTGPLLPTRWRSTNGDIGHALFLPPGWGAMDPAADGRRDSIWKYDGSPYPRELLRRAAGHLPLTFVNGRPVRLGVGFVYAAFTRDRRSTWTWERDPEPPARRATFVLWDADEAARSCRPVRTQVTRGTQPRTCTPPRLYEAPDGTTRELVRLLAGAYKGRYVHARWAKEIP